MACRVVDDVDLDDAMRVRGVKLFDFLLAKVCALDRKSLKVRFVLQIWIERKINLIPRSHISRGLAFVVKLTCFQISEVADVVRGPVAARARELLIRAFRQQRLFLK